MKNVSAFLRVILCSLITLGGLSPARAQQLIYDFGDAPTNYPTLLSAGGARHKVAGQLYLGLTADVETNGQPTLLANGDDLAGLADEDGVRFLTPIVPGALARVNVLVTGHGRLDAWLDFNRNFVWEGPEKIFNSIPVSNGVNALSFPVPTNAVYGRTYARFRLSTAGGLGTGGPAADGEVEDYVVNIVHTNALPHLGTTISLSSPAITVGDAVVVTLSVTNSGGDALGVVVTNRSDAGLVSDAGVMVNAACDNSGPAMWSVDSANNQWISLGSLPAGCSVSLVSTVRVDSASFNSLAGANELLTYSSHYDVSTSTVDFVITNFVPSFSTTVSNVVVKTKMDFGDAPDTYSTTLSHNGARHRITAQNFLGHYVDPENDGVPSVPANADDLIGAHDDEDGITFTTAITPGGRATNSVYSTGGGKLDAWVDFNHNGIFDASEQVYFSVPVPNGSTNLSFAVPPGALTGATYARFRLSTAGGLSPAGYAPDGEVEDYWVTIGNTATPDISVTMVPSTFATTCTSNLDFTITVANNGPGNANGILISLLLPNFHLVQTTGPGTFTNTAGGASLYLASLPPNGTVMYVARSFFDVFEHDLVPPGDLNTAANTVTVIATAMVSTGQPDSAPANNFVSIPLTVTNLLDYGDAPTHLVPWNYPTLLIDNGARHTKSTNHLGALIDYEANGAPSLNADGDDLAGLNDEDGAFWSTLTRGVAGSVTVAPNANGFVNVWLDLNGDGDWSDPGEHVIVDAFVPGGGPTTLTFPLPATGYTGITYGRVRYCSYRGLNFDGYARNGEVIDRKLNLLAPLKSTSANGKSLSIAGRGQALLSVNGNAVTVSNLGSSGQDGAYMHVEDCGDLPKTNACWYTNALQNVDVDLGGMDTSSDGSGIYLRSRGYHGTNQTLAVLGGIRIWRTNGVLTFNSTLPVIEPPDALPSATPTPFPMRVQVYGPNGFVGKTTFDLSASGSFTGTGNPIHFNATAYGRPALAVMFSSAMSLTIANHTLTGTTFRFSPADYAQARDRGSLDFSADELRGGLDDNNSVADTTRLTVNGGTFSLNNTVLRNEYLASAFESVIVSGYTPAGSFTVTKSSLGGAEVGDDFAITDHLQNVPLMLQTIGNGVQFSVPGVLGAEYQLQSSLTVSGGFTDLIAAPMVSATGNASLPVGTVNNIKIEHEGFYRVNIVY